MNILRMGKWFFLGLFLITWCSHSVWAQPIDPVALQMRVTKLETELAGVCKEQEEQLKRVVEEEKKRWLLDTDRTLLIKFEENSKEVRTKLDENNKEMAIIRKEATYYLGAIGGIVLVIVSVGLGVWLKSDKLCIKYFEKQIKSNTRILSRLINDFNKGVDLKEKSKLLLIANGEEKLKELSDLLLELNFTNTKSINFGEFRGHNTLLLICI